MRNSKVHSVVIHHWIWYGSRFFENCEMTIFSCLVLIISLKKGKGRNIAELQVQFCCFLLVKSVFPCQMVSELSKLLP